MSFNPLAEKGIPLEKWLRNWTELNINSYNKHPSESFSEGASPKNCPN